MRYSVALNVAKYALLKTGGNAKTFLNIQK